MTRCVSKDDLHVGERTVLGDLHFSQLIISQRTVMFRLLSSTYWPETDCVLTES
jgi:hypothetical protein